jgi:hypothetical protein
MPRSEADVMAHVNRIAGLPDHDAKKEALFVMIHDMVVEDVAEAKVNGATDAMLTPFTETVKHFEKMKSHIVAMNML